MNVNEWLSEATEKLEKAGIATARLDCLVLLEDALGKDRSYILAHTEEVINPGSVKKLNEVIQRRAGHEPLAYIRGKSEFYGREFLVNAHTLEPRPETETMIAVAIKVIGSRLEVRDEKPVIVDIGTGSGCIGITLKLELPELDVIATDIDEKCIETAGENADKLGADVQLHQGNLLEPFLALDLKISAVLCNLPYVPDDFQINEAAQFEPRHAIFGGSDGLDLYRDLFAQLTSQKYKVKSPKFILTESLPFQHEKLATIAEKTGYKLEKTDDFIQIFCLSS